MGKRKHYKLGKTEKVCVPICLIPKLIELTRVLDKVNDPNGILDKLIELTEFIHLRENDKTTRQDP